MTDTYDVAIIGAGPAGMAAADTATAAGARTVIIDSSPRTGGQFWRHGPDSSAELSKLHSSRRTYRRLQAAFDAAVASGMLTHLPSTSVWMATANQGGFSLHLACEDSEPQARPATVRARTVVVATGAYDLQLPVPGWELPGVMTAGGIQAFIKQNGFAPGKRFVIAGTGPFLLPVAVNISQVGAQVAQICESARLSQWAPHVLKAFGVPSKLLEGAGFIAALLARRIPYRTRTVITEILGDTCVEAVRTSTVDARGQVLPGTQRLITGVDGVGLGWGFTPQIDVPVQLGARTGLGADGSVVVAADPRGRSSVPGLFVAGEVTGVAGATLAIVEGAPAGAEAARYATGWAAVYGRSSAVTGVRAANNRRFAAAMHAVHPVPPAWPSWVSDPCLVCRCEEVTAGEVRRARTDLEATDQRTNKGATRAGMGWCQGRVCSFAVSGLAERAAPSLESLHRAAKRPIARPIPLHRIADLPAGAED